MKTLHYSIIVISLILIGGANSSMAHIAILQISTPKSNFTDGDIIPINGHALPNSTINIFLVNNYGNIQNSTQVKSNSTGYFNTSMGIPYHVIGGAWTLFAINDDSNFAMQLMVNFHGSNTPPFHSPSGFPPLKQFKLGIKPSYVQCRSDLHLIIKSEDGSPACVKPDTANILRERGWAEPVTSGISQTNRTNIKNNDPFGITALVIYHPFLGCLSSGCPHNNFYLKINSNSTAYLTGYSICDGESCAKNNNLSILLPINTILKNPNYASIELPESLKWKDGDTVTIQLKVSSTANDETGLLVDLGNSTIVP